MGCQSYGMGLLPCGWERSWIVSPSRGNGMCAQYMLGITGFMVSLSHLESCSKHGSLRMMDWFVIME
jgi:hypothetical protein